MNRPQVAYFLSGVLAYFPSGAHSLAARTLPQDEGTVLRQASPAQQHTGHTDRLVLAATSSAHLDLTTSSAFCDTVALE